MIIETEELSKKYTIDQRSIAVLSNISLQIASGEFVVISGSSGSGKTTLLSVLSGLDRPSSGRIRLSGRDITDLSESELAPMRNELIGFVFQAFHLIPSLNALENVMFPAELRHDRKAKEKAERLLQRVGLWDRRFNHPEQLSGGEKQRVSICRALINRPKIIFADEPTGNLDSENSRAVTTVLSKMHKEHDTTLVMATHSREIARQADRIIRLHDGCLTANDNE